MKAIQWGIKLPKRMRKFYLFLLTDGYQIRFENIVVTLNGTRDSLFCTTYNSVLNFASHGDRFNKIFKKLFDHPVSASGAKWLEKNERRFSTDKIHPFCSEFNPDSEHVLLLENIVGKKWPYRHLSFLTHFFISRCSKKTICKQ